MAIGAFHDKHKLFMRRVRVLQEEYNVPWEDAVTIAHELARIVREAETRSPPPAQDGPPTP